MVESGIYWVESWTSWVEFAGLIPGLIRLNPKNSKSITGLLGLNLGTHWVESWGFTWLNPALLELNPALLGLNPGLIGLNPELIGQNPGLIGLNTAFLDYIRVLLH